MSHIKLLKLKPILTSMRKKNYVSIVFNYIDNISIIFYDLKPKVLVFVKEIDTKSPQFISFKLNDDFSLNTDLSKSKYKKLTSFLGIQYDSENPFSPNHFFFELSQMIPEFKEVKKYNQLKRIYFIKEYVKIESPEKTVFVCDRQNTSSKVTEENLNKTRLYFGNKEANRCRKENISKCWKGETI